jgi:metal-dependent HD superfamily phosphatase/phosphodiesterase
MRTIIPLSTTLHDIGMSIHRTGHEQFSLVLAAPLIRRLLGGLYDEPVLTIMTSETLHAIILDQVLKPKLASSGLQQYVEVTASISGETERRLLPVYNL